MKALLSFPQSYLHRDNIQCITSYDKMLTKNVSGACSSDKISLPIDTACFSVSNQNKHPVTLFSSFYDCILCDGDPIKIAANENLTIQISTKYPLLIHYNDSESTNSFHGCNETFSFQQNGRYGWNISENGKCSEIYTLYEPFNPYLPLLAALMVYFLGFLVLLTSRMIINVVKTFIIRSSEAHDDLDRLQETESTPQLLTVSKTSMRQQALDAFRGIAVLLMIFVNKGGGAYVFFNHAPWNGLTVADLVLPWFAWSMGFTIVKSVRIHLRVSISRIRLMLKQFRRAVLLIFCGLLINSQHNYLHNTPLSQLRIPGVLQLLAFSYFICSLVETCCASAQRTYQFRRFVFLQDILERWTQWIVIFIIIIFHTCITFLLHVPGCPRGYIGPGGYHHHGEYMNCTGGAAAYIDKLIFGNHMYAKKTNLIYGPTSPHDPEGLMNSISATLIVFMGVQAGRIFVTYYQSNARIIRWIVWFIVTGLMAGILCNFSKENGVIPVNKNMMSLSFVLCTSSFAFLLFAILYYVIEYKKWWSGSPFIYAGANPILLYMGHYLTTGLFPFEWNINGIPTHTSLLAMNLWTTTLWTVIAYILYKKEILIAI